MKYSCIPVLISFLAFLSLVEAGIQKGFSKNFSERQHELPTIKKNLRRLAVGGTGDGNDGDPVVEIPNGLIFYIVSQPTHVGGGGRKS